MNPEPENFHELRRLLALKRHEQPPPGYFNSFSRQVIARIEAGEARSSWFGRFLGEGPWLQQLWSALGARPAFAGGFGLALCGVLVAGAIFSEDTVPPSGMAGVIAVPSSSVASGPVTAQTAAPLVDQAMPVSFSSTAGVLPQSSSSIFQELQLRQSQRPLFQRVEQNYVAPDGN